MRYQSSEIIRSLYPETTAGGFTRRDGTVQFYSRVNALLTSSATVLDFGAGRGAAFEDDTSDYRRSLRALKGKAREVVGGDVDPAVLQNRSTDRNVVFESPGALPFPDREFDLIVSDFTFEHIEDPYTVSRELTRILKPGGWICARTPNKFSIPGMIARIIRNSSHATLLRRVQPERKSIDVFPTVYRMNTISALEALFPVGQFTHCTYYFQPEPAYYFNSELLFRVAALVGQCLPAFFRSNLFIFLRKNH